MKNIKNSIIYINSSGPAFLQDIENSIIFVTSHQLRIHNTTDSIILTMELLNGIIENSSGLIFKPLEGDIEINDFDHPGLGDKSPSFKKLSFTEDDLELKKGLEDYDVENLEKALQDLEMVINKAKE
ncbi:Tubulin-specific chaperone C [Wickerhamomyces ciferrii]|uniref:Tubulin-specific chaperone C n=1 Tax=Wickerhamomyces ciferrii (strain ATCC 14091 / BCRC 22168 / CBS 111 / JCM 3599 / NBRC 0793 / NRRL Y-1031 F-60-10) TaxID=1206466 RepID=K0KIS6_WICCF|nr:Tubulin-specific chaperone C [Wickerhamomyces ciferrii]CCH42891.1 Tubulin-specific chaperone C [Wickerhamomyces ciferrii]